MIIDRKDSSYQKPKKQEVEAENLPCKSARWNIMNYHSKRYIKYIHVQYIHVRSTFVY